MMPAQNRDVFHAVADPTRREILELLATADMPVHRLARHFNISRPAISAHLRVLREAHLVSERKSGRERVYSLIPGPLREVRMWIAYFDPCWDLRLKRLKTHLNGNLQPSEEK
jgi:DNA-binding transcriptional ArsR family regulator